MVEKSGYCIVNLDKSYLFNGFFLPFGPEDYSHHQVKIEKYNFNGI